MPGLGQMTSNMQIQFMKYNALKPMKVQVAY